MTTKYERMKKAVVQAAANKNATGKLLIQYPASRKRTMVFLIDKALLDSAVAERRDLLTEEIGKFVYLQQATTISIDPEVYPLEVSYRTPQDREGCLITAGTYREDCADRVAGYILHYLITGETPPISPEHTH